MKEHFDDAELAQAARKVREAMLSSLHPENTDDFILPDEFVCNMNQVAGKTLRRRKIMKFSQQVAAIFVVVLLSATIWLSFDSKARDTFFFWIREQYEKSILYRFFNVETEHALPNYAPSWLPEGYSLVFDEYGDALRTCTYSDGASEIYLDYFFATMNVQAEIMTETADSERVNVHDAQADFFAAETKEDMNELFWMDESQGIAFSLAGFCSQEELIQIAESIELQ